MPNNCWTPCSLLADDSEQDSATEAHEGGKELLNRATEDRVAFWVRPRSTDKRISTNPDGLTFDKLLHHNFLAFPTGAS